MLEPYVAKILSYSLLKIFAPAIITKRIFTPLYYLLLLAESINVSMHLLKQREGFQTVVYLTNVVWLNQLMTAIFLSLHQNAYHLGLHQFLLFIWANLY